MSISNSTFMAYEGLMFGPASINSIHMLSIACIAARGNLLLFDFLNQIVQNLCLSSLNLSMFKDKQTNSTVFCIPHSLFEKRVAREEGMGKEKVGVKYKRPIQAPDTWEKQHESVCRPALPICLSTGGNGLNGPMQKSWESTRALRTRNPRGPFSQTLYIYNSVTSRLKNSIRNLRCDCGCLIREEWGRRDGRAWLMPSHH